MAVLHKVHIVENGRTVVKRDLSVEPNIKFTVAKFIFSALGKVMRSGFGLYIKSATLDGKAINANTTPLPNVTSEISAIVGSGPKVLQ